MVANKEKVSIPVRGSGKSKAQSANPRRCGSRVSIPVRGSGKSKLGQVGNMVKTTFNPVSIPVRGSGKSKV